MIGSMKQVFIVGASIAYGVGGAGGGWGELIKHYAHGLMYEDGGVGEKYEVFNFAKPGETVDFILDTFPDQLKQYGRGGELTTVVSVGGNSSKAVDTPDNFVSTVEEYVAEMKKLLTLLKTASHVIIVSNSYVDESKTNPKLNPLNGTKSYFTNKRRSEFRAALKKLCEEQSVTFVDADGGISPEEWKEHYLYSDGLHPNTAGHQYIFERIKPLLPF